MGTVPDEASASSGWQGRVIWYRPFQTSYWQVDLKTEGRERLESRGHKVQELPRGELPKTLREGGSGMVSQWLIERFGPGGTELVGYG